MPTRFPSLRLAIALSAAAWLTELWRAWLDMMFEYPGGIVGARLDSGVTLALTVIYTAVFGAWAYAMHLASRGSRRGLMAAFALNLLIWLAIPVGWVVAYCTGDCPARAGVFFNVGNWLNLVFGLLAAVALGVRILRNDGPVVRS